MNDNKQTAFIIDIYDKFHDKDKIRMVFYLNGRWWAIKETILQWGTPVLDTFEDDYQDFHIYDTFEEAQQFVHSLKRMEGARL